MHAACGTFRDVHVTLSSLSNASGPVRREAHPDVDRTASDGCERDILGIVTRLSRRPIDPTPDNELVADLGFDSLQVLELVGELEDHFNIAIPLNSLTHIRTVSQITDEVQRLVREGPRS